MGAGRTGGTKGGADHGEGDMQICKEGSRAAEAKREEFQRVAADVYFAVEKAITISFCMLFDTTYRTALPQKTERGMQEGRGIYFDTAKKVKK